MKNDRRRIRIMKMTIGGKKVDARNGKTIDVYCPATGEFINTVPAATEEDVKEAISMAKRGQKIWNGIQLHKRLSILRRFIKLLDKNKEKIARTLSMEQARPYAQNLADVINNVENTLPGYLDVCRHHYGKTTTPGAYEGKEHDFQVIVREPLGVIATIIPFNSPVNVFLKKAIPALATGNSIVVKPASDVPLAMIMMTDLFIEAGVTPEAVSIVTGSGEAVGRWISTNPEVAGISFTGSTRAGSDIIKMSSVNITRCFMELGGNDAFIVREDADLDLAVKEARIGRTFNAGQICASPKRYLVNKKVCKEFTKKLIEELKKVKIGNPLEGGIDMGCMVSEKAAVNAVNQIGHTVSQGARIVYGGEREGAFLIPTVLADVTKEMDVATDMEIFAPVFPIIEVDSDEEAIEIANASVYGLSGSVISCNMKEAIHIANQMDTAQVVINGQGFYGNPEIPFGGYKKSGLGREGIMSTMDEFTQEKAITFRDILY